MNETIRCERIGESYTRLEHPSGLTILMYPMENFSSAYALFGTKYGSVDTCFKTEKDSDFIQVPEGVAHFLEHKLFEDENGEDAFNLYAKTGANANAFTSFDKTAYLFSCTEKFDESIDILLDFVTKPFFSKATVEKEQGIIGQEIKMYEDSAGWRVFFNMLGAMYTNNPVRIDIAGTVESISRIDADVLYRCYNTFYNLRNMVLAVAGNFDPADVLRAADRILKPAEEQTIERSTVDEPQTVKQSYIEQILPVALPLFQIGFKGIAGTEHENVRGMVLDEIILDVIAGESTPLYRELYDEGLINSTFAAESMAARDYSLAMYSGESRDPKAVCERISKHIAKLRKDGLPPELFARYKKAAYGKYVDMYAKASSLASLMLSAQFTDTTAYSALEMVADATLEAAQKRFETSFDPQYSVLSVVKSK